ncbi:MAG: LysE family transporter [Pseudohongiellaceae bacterium]
MGSPFFYLLVGFFACFIGTIPFGPINLAVVKTTIDFDRRSGTEFAFAASLVEVLQAFVAISFGVLISTYLESNIAIKFILASLFITLAIFIYTRKPNPTMANPPDRAGSFFRNGMLIAMLNPQALPYWMFALAAISQYFPFQYSGVYLMGFLTGVLLGKLLALYGFVVASGYLKTHMEKSSLLVNRVLAAILLFIGLSQGWNAVNSLLG